MLQRHTFGSEPHLKLGLETSKKQDFDGWSANLNTNIGQHLEGKRLRRLGIAPLA